MNIIFWGSSEYSMSPLKKIYENFNLLAVITNPDSYKGRGYKELSITPVKDFALKNNIKIFQPSKLRDNDELLNSLKELNADLNVIVSYGKILPVEFINLPKYKSINLHASLLPKYRGASPIQAALINGDTTTGNSIQFINEKLDAGDILSQNKIEIDINDDYISLEDKLSSSGAELLIDTINRIKNNSIKPIPQNEKEATYCPLITKEDGLIDFKTEDARKIYNKFRAFKKWPGIYFINDNKRYFIEEMKITFGDFNYKPVIKEKDRLIIFCSGGLIEIIKIKPEGKKSMYIKDFLNGFKGNLNF